MHIAALLALGGASVALAHGEPHSETPAVSTQPSWMQRHMDEEHHMADFDAASFFQLHDFDGDKQWGHAEILRTYGLFDESNQHVAPERVAEIVREVMDLVDADHDGQISLDEFLAFMAAGKTLPDMGTGPGHHGDDEYEYEIHHWEKYHDENTKLDDLTHPEDIEHFRKHEQLEEEEERMAKLAQLAIVEENIPSKFLRVQE